MALDVRAKRVYDPAEPGDGYRVLIDHVWPRGVSRERAHLDEWARELAPSDELRRWFDHVPERFDEFRARYRDELAAHGELLDELRQRARQGPADDRLRRPRPRAQQRGRRRRAAGGRLMLGLPDGVRACLFDLDGVLTQTAKVHAAAWKEMFDGYLRERAAQDGEEFVAFDPVGDYDEYVDGKPRYEGVRSFLDSRGIDLPQGEPERSARRRDDRRARQPQERDRAADDPRSGRPGL